MAVTLNLILNLLIAISTLQALILKTENFKTNVVESEWEEEDVVEEGLEEKWFEQYVNHFDAFDNRTFKIRYFEEDKFFKPGGPLLLEIGGEGAINHEVIKNGQSYQLAEQLNGKIILVEHRYYGKSVPFDNLTTDTFAYLTVEQALEDLAYFVDTIKRTATGLQFSKVAAFGCSYSGALATWLRYKFPHIVDAAWASSAPLRAVSDFYEYLEVAMEVYSNVSVHCVDIIRNGYNEAKILLSTSEGEKKLKSVLATWGCGNITEMDAKTILANIRYVIVDHNFAPDHGISSCKILMSQQKHLSAFDKLVAFLLSKSDAICPDPFEDYPDDGAAWIYQTCTEFGYSITSNSKKNPFNDTWNAIDEDLQICSDHFEDEFNKEILQKGIDRINRVYGSVHLKGSKILSVHGAQDPWHKLGIYYQTNEEMPVIIISEGSHCSDQSTKPKEPSQFTKAKIAARRIMKKWLQL